MSRVDLIDGLVMGVDTLNLAIAQGETYQISFNYPSDVSLATPYGQIRSKYAQDVNELLAEFTFLSLVYDEETEKTLITAQLSATVTASIPYTRFQGEGKPSTTNCHVYDLELHFVSGVVKKIVHAGFVQVKPEVTKPEPEPEPEPEVVTP